MAHPVIHAEIRSGGSRRAARLACAGHVVGVAAN